MNRFPLRASQRRQLKEWIDRDGERAVIRAARVSREELDAVVAAQVPPMISDRARLIVGLMRAGFDQGRGDPHGPGREGFEVIAGVDYAERLEREQARAERRERRARQC